MIIIGAVGAASLMAIAAAFFYKFSGSLVHAAKFLISPFALSIGSLAAELVDFFSDALACRNVLRSEDGNISSHRTAYILLTVFATFAFTLGFIERILNAKWQWKRQRNKAQRSISKASVQPSEETANPTPQEDEDALTEVEHDIKAIYARAGILVFEDTPMLAMNAYIIIKYEYINAVMMVSVLFSALLAGSKFRSIVFLRKYEAERMRLAEKLGRD